MNALCGTDVCSERTAGCRRRKLSNAVRRSNKKTLSHGTILLFFKTGEESGLLKPAPAAHQLCFWKTELLSKIFVLANIISELPGAPGAIWSSQHTLPVHTGSLHSQRAISQLQGRGDPWGPAVYFLSGSLQPCCFAHLGTRRGSRGCLWSQEELGAQHPCPAPCPPADIPDNEHRTPSPKAHKEECAVCVLPAVLNTSFRLI